MRVPSLSRLISSQQCNYSSSGPSIVRVEECQLPAGVPVISLGADGIDLCGRERSRAGCHYSAGIVGLHILTLQRGRPAGTVPGFT